MMPKSAASAHECPTLSMQEAREVLRHSHEFPHTREAEARAHFYL